MPRRLAPLPLALTLGLLACGPIPVGGRCSLEAADCADDTQCLPNPVTDAAYIASSGRCTVDGMPGVCSLRCESAQDCGRLGEGFSCKRPCSTESGVCVRPD